MINQKQMLEVINDVLTKLGSKYNSNNALSLVYNTGLVESKYKYLKQIKGPARGFFQCEPWVAVDIIKNYLKYRVSLMEKVAKVCAIDFEHLQNPNVKDWEYILTTNIAAQIVMCRLHYRRVPSPLPKELVAEANYYKKYYNTYQGKATVEHYLEVVEKYG